MARNRTVAVSKRRGDQFDVYCGRPSIFGNHHTIGVCAAKGCGQFHKRGEAIAAYRKDFYKYLIKEEWFRREVKKLKGKRLACWCAPQPCHVDVIVEYLDGKE